MDVDIVEKNLIEKLESREGEGSEINEQILRNCSLFSFHKELDAVKKVIGEKKPERDVEIEKLYSLLNVKADWLELRKNPHFLKTHAANELGRRVNQIKNKLEVAATTKGGGGGGGSEDPAAAWFSTKPEIYRWSSQAVDLENFKIHGFEEKGMVMERLLLKENMVVNWIVGVVGVGKTALCQLALSRQQVKNYFPLRIWLCLSKHNKADAAQGSLEKRILSCLGFEDEAIPEQHRLQVHAMRRQLKRGRYLIVLDDVSKEDCNLISFLTQDQELYGSGPGRGGALLVTSRDREYEYVEKIKIANKHNLLPLVDDHGESCWNIFSDAVERDGIVKLPEEMIKQKQKIVEKGEGLPLMAKMLGLIGQDIAKSINDPPQSDQEIQAQQQ